MVVCGGLYLSNILKIPETPSLGKSQNLRFKKNNK
jgi:hypothetical protein